VTPPGRSLVSVVTPCFNGADFIAETLQAVRGQIFPRVEHIVVDDGSTDDSVAVIERFEPAVRLIRTGGNRGAAAARNTGAAAASGTYLMFLDADDIIAPGTVAALVQAIQDRPLAIGVCPWDRLVLRDREWVTMPAPVPFPPPADALAGWLEGIWVPPCAVLWRKDAFDLTGGWTEDFNPNDDGDLMMRALLRGASLVVADGGRSCYRMHDATRLSLSTSSFMDGRLEAQVAAFNRLENEMTERGVLETYSRSLGTAYRKLALRAFHHDHREVGRACSERAERLGGRRDVSRTALGRLLERILGVELKERLANALARIGLVSKTRRRHRRLRAGRSPASPREQR
jgi:glycosyltransferase involved in cell wall biosynthesis